MSYVSGFMLGASIGKAIHQAMVGGPAPAAGARAARRAPAPQAVRAAAAASIPPLKLIAATPGRRRYRAIAIAPELAASLEANLGKLAFIKSVSVNAVSASILVTYDEKNAAQVDALAKWLFIHVFTPQTAPAPQAVNTPSEAHAGSITKSIRNSTRAFSGWINKSTCGWFDISSLASFIFIIRGLRKMVLTQQYPSGSQMMWWALALMRGWRTV